MYSYSYIVDDGSILLLAAGNKTNGETQSTSSSSSESSSDESDETPDADTNQASVSAAAGASSSASALSSEAPRAKRARMADAAAEVERRPELANHERQLEVALLRQLLERRPLSTRELLTKFRAKLVRAGHHDASIAALSSRLPDLIRALSPSQTLIGGQPHFFLAKHHSQWHLFIQISSIIFLYAFSVLLFVYSIDYVHVLLNVLYSYVLYILFDDFWNILNS